MANINDLGRLIANAVKAGLQDLGGGGGGGTVVNSSNVVVPRPVFTNLTQGPSGPVPPYGASNVINPPFANTGGGSGGRPSFGTLGGAALAGTLSMMPGAVQANFVNYITTRAGSFSGMAPSGAQGQSGLFGLPPMPGDERTGQYNYMSQLMRNMARTGTVTSAMDIPAAIANMQFRYNFSGPGSTSFLTGAAAMSNLTPGAGVERTSAALFGAFMDPTRQNRMRMLGMSVTDPQTGMPKDPRTIADQIYNRLNMQKMGTKPISREDIQRSLLPGRSLDSMLNMLVGDDPLARNQIATLLIAKAMSGGASAYDVTTKESLIKLGATTEGMVSGSNRAAAELQGIQSVARAETYGLTKANEAAAILAETLSRLNSQFGFATPGAVGAGFFDTIKNAFGFGGPKAKGGDVSSKNAYLVGEAGPELFVPNASGYVVPNHELRFAGARHDGGYVHPHPHPEWSKKDLDAEGRLSTSKVREILGHVGFKGEQVNNAMQIIGKESARRPGALNPHGKDLSYGLFQINMLGDLGPDRRKRYGLSSNDILYDPLKNAMVGYEMSNQGTNWNAWSTAEGLGLKSGSGTTGGGSTSVTNSLPESGSGGFWQSALNNIASVARGLFGASSMGQVINYGGVSVDVIMPKGSGNNPEEFARRVKKVLEQDQIQQRAKGN